MSASVALDSRTMPLDNLRVRLVEMIDELDQMIAATNSTPLAQPLEPKIFTVNDVSRLLGMSRSRVYTLIRSGELNSVKLGGLRRVTPDQVDAFVHSLNVAPKEFR